MAAKIEYDTKQQNRTVRNIEGTTAVRDIFSIIWDKLRNVLNAFKSRVVLLSSEISG